jgi:hypothetical protein
MTVDHPHPRPPRCCCGAGTGRGRGDPHRCGVEPLVVARWITVRRHTASDSTVGVAPAMRAEAQRWSEAVTMPTDRTVAGSLELASPSRRRGSLSDSEA